MLWFSPRPRPPQTGDTRHRRRFALFPRRVRTNNDYIVWLGWYVQFEVYEERPVVTKFYTRHRSTRWFPTHTEV